MWGKLKSRNYCEVFLLLRICFERSELETWLFFFSLPCLSLAVSSLAQIPPSVMMPQAQSNRANQMSNFKTELQLFSSLSQVFTIVMKSWWAHCTWLLVSFFSLENFVLLSYWIDFFTPLSLSSLFWVLINQRQTLSLLPQVSQT